MRAALLLSCVLTAGCANMTDEQRARMQEAGARMQAAGAALGEDSPSSPQTVNCTTYDHGVVRNTTCTESQ